MLTVRHFDFTEYLKARSAHPRLLSSLPPLEYLSNISNIPSSSDGIYSSSCRRCRFGSREEKKILGAIHYFLLRKGKRLFFENGWLWGDRQLYSWLILKFLFRETNSIRFISSNLKFSNFETICKYLFLFIIRRIGVALEVGKKRKSLERFVTLREREKECWNGWSSVIFLVDNFLSFLFRETNSIHFISSNLKFSNFEVIHKYLFLFIIRQVGVALEVGKKRKSLERFITLREREKNCSSKMGDHGMIVNYIFGW